MSFHPMGCIPGIRFLDIVEWEKAGTLGGTHRQRCKMIGYDQDDFGLLTRRDALYTLGR